MKVRCWSREDWQRELRRWSVYVGRPVSRDSLGFTLFPRNINLGPDVCAGLEDLAYRQDRPRNRVRIAKLATAVARFATEIELMRDPRIPSAAAGCYAMQELRETAEAIGVDITYSPVLLRVYYRDIYRHLPAASRSPQCHRGGRLDLDILYTWP